MLVPPVVPGSPLSSADRALFAGAAPVKVEAGADSGSPSPGDEPHCANFTSERAAQDGESLLQH